MNVVWVDFDLGKVIFCDQFLFNFGFLVGIMVDFVVLVNEWMVVIFVKAFVVLSVIDVDYVIV